MQSKNKNITYLKKCKICGNTNLKKVLFINEQYISATFVKTNANNKLTEIKTPLTLVLCVKNGENKNFLTDKVVSLPKKAKYEIYFPDNLNKKSVDEYLFLIGSEKKIDWLDKYTKIEDLKKAYINEKFIIYKYKEYTIYK